MKTREDTRMVKLETQNHKPFFGRILEKMNTFTYGTWSFLLIHIWFTPSEGPKGFVNLFLKKLDLEVRQWKRPSSTVRLPAP